jgi:hypothetical protein
MSTQTETAIVKDYVNAGGLQTYYEAQGSGEYANWSSSVRP